MIEGVDEYTLEEERRLLNMSWRVSQRRRCIIRPHGRGKGIDRVEIGYDTLWWVVHGGEMYDCETTRADAAQAAYRGG